MFKFGLHFLEKGFTITQGLITPITYNRDDLAKDISRFQAFKEASSEDQPTIKNKSQGGRSPLARSPPPSSPPGQAVLNSLREPLKLNLKILIFFVDFQFMHCLLNF